MGTKKVDFGTGAKAFIEIAHEGRNFFVETFEGEEDIDAVIGKLRRVVARLEKFRDESEEEHVELNLMTVEA